MNLSILLKVCIRYLDISFLILFFFLQGTGQRLQLFSAKKYLILRMKIDGWWIPKYFIMMKMEILIVE